MTYKQFFSILLTVQLLFISVAYSAAPAGVVNISYGKNNRVIYNLEKGTLTVFAGKEQVFSAISASVKLNGKLISSKDYSARKVTKTAVANGFGKGQKYVITLTGNGLPQMQQAFYAYPNSDYFFTEVTVKGNNIKTNHIIPFEGSFKKPGNNAYSIFMPFDNDTFISYESKPFKTGSYVSAEAGVVFDNGTRNAIIAGSVEQMVWKTGVTTVAGDDANTIQVLGGYTSEDITRDKISHGEVSGEAVKSPLIFIGYFADWRDGLEAYGKANRIAEPPVVFNWTKPTPVGWNSWGVIQEKLTYDKAVKVAGFFADSLKNFKTGNTAYIDLDSYWDGMLKGGLTGDYSRLKEFADYCKKRGLEPGVYWAPFTDWGFKGGADRKVQGSNYTYGDIWTKTGENSYHDLDGARALDPTHPGTQQRMALVLGKLKECGFKMIKIDFLGHGAIESTGFYDKTVTTGMQAYRKGMEYLVQQLGDQMLIYAAISPNLASGRYVHTRRIACDAFKTIKDTRYTINSVNFGWWQTYLYNYVDADHIVFADQAAGANRARLLSGVITGTFIAGDDFSTAGPWQATAQKYFQDPELLKVIAHGKAFRPVDGDTGKGASEIFTRKIGKVIYLAVFNYGDEAKEFAIDAGRLGFDTTKKYSITGIIQNSPLKADAKNIAIRLNGADAALYKFEVN